MIEAQPQTIFLKDYQVPDFLIKTTNLLVQIKDEYTLVTSRLELVRNPESKTKGADLTLVGVELETVSISVDGKVLAETDYEIIGDILIIAGSSDQFVLETQVKITPQSNTSLEGFYESGTMFCTQCEAEGFRKITWYLDRPDAMSVFTTRIEADQTRFPILLGNGNPVGEGELDDNRHFAEWHDPFMKPAYLFARKSVV